MAHFAKLGKGNIVLTVEVIHDNVATTEQAGVEFLQNLYKSMDMWKQTFKDGTRKNFAGIDFTYDPVRDAFIPPKPFNSWTLNETTCLWESPVSRPELTQEQIDNNNYYSWNETNQTWDLTTKE
jgi:hypothetical protein